MKHIALCLLMACLSGSLVAADSNTYPLPVNPVKSIPQNTDGPWYRDCRVWSTLSLLAAHSFDAASSWGGVEANPVLASGPTSRFGARGTALKFSFTGGYMVLQTLLMKKHPESKKAFCAANFAGAAAVSAVAVRNLSAPR